jgi:S-adenosylmethionine:tRNA ribosyltransferase-isomerase
MKVDLFDFELPDRCIAQSPAEPRDSAKLLLVPGSGAFADQRVSDLPDLLQPQDLLVVNDTKVLPTRLLGQRGTAGIEVTLIKERASDLWDAFARPGKKLKLQDQIVFNDSLTAVVQDKRPDGQITLRFNCQGAALREALWQSGTMPLPPYIKRSRTPDRDTDAKDRDRYQTLFAEREGAVAAPTASLHFTPTLLQRLDAKGIPIVRLTLHVGAGTFLPVKVEDTDDHPMHSEWAQLSPEAASRLNAHKASGGRIVAVGTTPMRTLESAAAPDGTLAAFEGETDIFITPGYRFRAVDRLMTNFHLPRSTLFMLVSAFSGLDRMQAAYAHAISNGYRFYSYGDSSLLDCVPVEG